MEVELIPILPGQEDEGKAAVRTAPNLDRVEEHVDAVIAGQASLYARCPASPPLIGYLARDPATGAVIGSCSFILRREAEAVEIAYFTFPPYEGRGYAKAMARALLSIAATVPEHRRLVAFTLPSTGASSHILASHGFSRAGVSIDEDAGEVWAWERR